MLSTTWYSWEVAAARSSYGNSPYSTAVFNSNLSTSSCQYDPALTKDVYLPKWNAECYAEAYNPSNLVLNNINRDLGHSAQMNLQIAGMGAKRYHIGSRTAIVEYGGKFRNDHKFADTYVETMTPNGTVPLSTFPNRLTNTNYYNGGTYSLGYNPTYSEVAAYASAHPSDFQDTSTFGQDPSQFDLVEKISAGYVMNTIDFSGRLRFIAGCVPR